MDQQDLVVEDPSRPRVRKHCLIKCAPGGSLIKQGICPCAPSLAQLRHVVEYELDDRPLCMAAFLVLGGHASILSQCAVLFSLRIMVSDRVPLLLSMALSALRATACEHGEGRSTCIE